MKSYTGKNLEDVLKQAAADKGVSVEELTYTVTEETSGFLGLGSKTTITAYCRNDIREFMKTYLQTYFEGIHMEVSIDVVDDGEYFRVNLDAENNAILIGKNGQTLQAINTVLKSASSSEFKRRIGVLNPYPSDRDNICFAFLNAVCLPPASQHYSMSVLHPGHKCQDAPLYTPDDRQHSSPC